MIQGMKLKEVEKFVHNCSCEACRHGCKFGSGILIGEDAKKLAKFLGVTEKELEEKYLEETEQFGKTFLRPKVIRNGKPYGRCMFFEEERCRIHEAKPLQCRLAMGCKDYGEDLMVWFAENCIIGSEKTRKDYEMFVKAGRVK